MDPILQTLLSWQFVIFSMAIAAVMFVLRTLAEYAMSNWASAAKESKLWNDLLLPILPVIVGPAAAVLIKAFPYPDCLTTSSSRFIFGLVAGLLSTLLYRVFKALLLQKESSPNQFGGIGYPVYQYPPTGVPQVGVPQVGQPGIAQAGVITPDNPANPVNLDELASRVRQTINKQ